MKPQLQGSYNQGVLLQPCGQGAPSNHFKTTVQGGYDLEDNISLFHESNHPQVLSIARSEEGPIGLWGITDGGKPAPHPQNHRLLWEQIRDDDVVAFIRSGIIFATARIRGKLRDRQAAVNIWRGGKVFENIYFFNQIRSCSLSLDTVVRSAKNEGALEASVELDVSTPYRTVYPTAELADIILDLLGHETPAGMGDSASRTETVMGSGGSGPTDRFRSAISRTEQAKLKGSLLEEDQACAFCQTTLPDGFLWAAHLKKRAACTEEERWDHPAVGALACKFGCDDLYEAGYIGVDDQGCLLVSEQIPDELTTHPHVVALKKRAGTTAGKVLGINSRKYYLLWHRENTYRSQIPSSNDDRFIENQVSKARQIERFL